MAFSAMSWGSLLLTTATWFIRVGFVRRIIAGPLGFPSEHLPSQLDHFGCERFNQLLFLLDLGFPLDRASMLSLPIVSLLA